ncbi:T9SS type A sorting domain-containing protein [Gabonia massiliensis]|jgi:hypothetical protein|uniref:T9SS type A sorting domain-containing protein n=1 Tax=Gabonia massiliensis TaxID=1686296 RepID=UPI0006D77EA9|nr:T9SS type A sorting domain-containing protein [Gabonia massiliensis]
MKPSVIKTSISILILYACFVLKINAQDYDYTSHIINPSFENGSTGWTIIPGTFSIATDYGLGDGTCRAKFSGKVNPSMSQTIVVPNGHYKLSFQYSAGNFTTSKPSIKVNGIVVYTLENGGNIKPSVEFDITELSIHLVISGNGLPNNGWLDIDNFKLTGNVAPEIEKGPLNLAIISAQTTYNGALASDYVDGAKESLLAAIQAAVNIRNNDNVTQTEINTAIEDLNQAVKRFNYSKRVDVTITIKADQIIKDICPYAVGINTNYVNDSQANRPQGSQSLSDAFKEMGTRIIRYPGGQKSNYYCWSTSDVNYAYPNPKLSRYSTHPGDFPSTSYWIPAADPNGDWKYPPLNFDDFMSVVKDAGAEANIVINYNNLRVPALNGGSAISFDEGLTMAVSWVRYANITKKYNVKYWTIGNETYNALADGSYLTAEQYGKDVSTFSKAMKAVDPTIEIGLCVKDVAWMNTALKYCINDIDFIDYHNYPIYRNYEAFHNWDANWLHPELEDAISSLPEPQKSKLYIAITEAGANTDGDDAPNTGTGLENFNVLTNLIGVKKIKFAQFWGTRYTTPNIQRWYHTLYENNTLNANGLAISVLSNNLLDKLIESSSTNNLRVTPFACKSNSDGSINVYLLNKSYVKANVTVLLKNYDFTANSAEYWIYKGTNDQDLMPTYKRYEDIPVSNGIIKLDLEPVSINVLKIKNPLTSSSELSKTSSSINVCPNPFYGKTSFDITLSNAEKIQIQITDIQGRIVDNFTYNGMPGKNKIYWEISNLTQPAVPGIYIYRTTIGGKLHTGKLIYIKN